MTDHAARARRELDQISGDRISGEMTPVVVAQLLEAQTHAILAVADRLDAILGHLEDRTIHVARVG